ncbi:MAG: hypothetical protein P8Z36_01350 [Gemmatimonadota bacterium]|jgi:hypothetical protein
MRFSVLLPVLLLALAGCGKDGTAPSGDPLVGSWEADPRCLWDCWFTIRSITNPADSLNLTDQASARFELDLRSNGSYQMVLSAPPNLNNQDDGTYTSTAGLLILSGADGVDTVDYHLASPLLRLSFRRHLALVDLSGDGVPDTVTVEASLKKF